MEIKQKLMKSKKIMLRGTDGLHGTNIKESLWNKLSKNELGKGRLKGTDGYVFIKPLKPQTYMTKWEGP